MIKVGNGNVTAAAIGLSVAMSQLLLFVAEAGIVPDFDYRLDPWKVPADQWRGSPYQQTSVTNWLGYERLAVDIVNYDVGGDAMVVYLKSGRQMTSLVSFRTPCLSARTYELPLSDFAAAGVDLANVTAVSFSARWARALDSRIFNVRLLKKDEVAMDAKLSVVMRERLRKCRDVWKASRADLHSESYARWRSDCLVAGTVSGGAVIGKASSMCLVRPRDEFEAEPAINLAVRLARNEKESIQLLVAPDGKNLANVRVSVSDLSRERRWDQMFSSDVRFAADNITVSPMGYVALRRVPEHSARLLADSSMPDGWRREPVVPGWYPDPILDFLDKVDEIRNDDVQGFWIKVRCPENQPAGVYNGKVLVTWTVDGIEKSWEAPFAIRVNDFSLDKVSPIPLNMSFQPRFHCKNWDRLGRIVGKGVYERERWIEAHTNCAPYLARRRIDEWTDFLADNLITIDFLYPMVEPRWSELARLKAEGRLGCFNLKYWSDESNNDEWFADARLRYEKARQLGVVDHAVFYGADELPKSRFPAVEAMAARLKREFPNVRIVTTLKDKTYSVDSEVKSIDVFVPVTGAFCHANALKARTIGKKVGWYVCGGGDDPCPEFFFGRDAIEPRLITSAMAAKYAPEWFVYYAMAGWSTIDPITDGPYTKWSPEGWQDYPGDGNIVSCGPDGKPLTTMRLENFRDGLEDYAYAIRYRELYGKDAEVPSELIESLERYAHNPKALEQWRDRLADLIEARCR